jgi:hypothetical protein
VHGVHYRYVLVAAEALYGAYSSGYITWAILISVPLFLGAGILPGKYVFIEMMLAFQIACLLTHLVSSECDHKKCMDAYLHDDAWTLVYKQLVLSRSYAPVLISCL